MSNSIVHRFYLTTILANFVPALRFLFALDVAFTQMVHFLMFFLRVSLPVLLLILTLDFCPLVTFLTEKRTLEEP